MLTLRCQLETVICYIEVPFNASLTVYYLMKPVVNQVNDYKLIPVYDLTKVDTFSLFRYLDIVLSCTRSI